MFTLGGGEEGARHKKTCVTISDGTDARKPGSRFRMELNSSDSNLCPSELKGSSLSARGVYILNEVYFTYLGDERLCLVQIASVTKVYLFDVIVIGPDVFREGGLGDVLQSKKSKESRERGRKAHRWSIPSICFSRRTDGESSYFTMFYAAFAFSFDQNVI